MAILFSATHNELEAIWKLAINELESELDKFPTETIPRTRISHISIFHYILLVAVVIFFNVEINLIVVFFKN